MFLPPERLAAFREAATRIGRDRDLEWISVDPLVPLGPAATGTVQGLDVPADWLRDNRDGGVFGVIGRVSVRDGTRRTGVLGRAHPGAAWLEWTARPSREQPAQRATPHSGAVHRLPGRSGLSRPGPRRPIAPPHRSHCLGGRRPRS